MSGAPDRKPARTALLAVGVVLFMGAMAWVAVPFYNWFCRVTGYGGTPAVAEGEAGPGRVLDRTIEVRFDGNVDRGMPWKFRPVTRQMTLRIGETGLAFYEATNVSDRPITGTASYNVVPYSAASHFVKVDCFCFTEQTLQPGETVQMPVTFYVDPGIVDDPEARYVPRITLSYTFHELKKDAEDAGERQAALGAGGAQRTN